MKTKAVRILPTALLTGMLGLAVGLAVSIVLAVLVLLLSGSAQAAADSELIGSPAEAGSGQLLFRHDGQFALAPVLDTDVQIHVSGVVARARVAQRFRNPHDDWQEGIYVFPLPEGAAVDRMRMTIGERVIEGQIREREQARKQYEKAVREGKRASLLEQERANIFTTSVANIGPGETIKVTIEYQQTVRYDAGRFELRFPMVVGPRYIPGRVAVSGFAGSGWAANTDQVPDAARITPPVRRPDGELHNPVSISVELNAGMDLLALDSRYHPVDIESSNGRYRINLQQGPVPADRDFVLSWRPAVGSEPRAALFVDDSHKRGRHALLMVMPPEAEAAATQGLSRQLVFVIDTSGSMDGPSIRQAREAVAMALTRLRPQDVFNVIQFNSVTEALFPAPREATQENIAAARKYVANLRATGGTEMAPALSLALRQPDVGQDLRQVVFLTDGAVGNEIELFSIIERELGDSRLFTIGIGSAPNGYFMSRAARFGRGTHTFIGKTSEVEEQMAALFEKLERAVMRDITVQWPAASDVQMWPERIPDLYAGEPLLLAIRGDAAKVLINGRFAGKPWQAELTLTGGQSNPAVPVLWARRKIADLMAAQIDGGDGETTRKQVVDTALDYHLVSKYTSLVAVDVTPARVKEQLLRKRNIASNLPHGWNYDKVFGGLPATGTPSYLWLLAGSLLLLSSLVQRSRMRA
jgi:Ca-activated chloride channel family protein